jgi:hypothetical protein
LPPLAVQAIPADCCSRLHLLCQAVKLAACDRLDAALTLCNQTLEEGQEIAGGVLYAKARLGELLRDREPPNSLTDS